MLTREEALDTMGATLDDWIDKKNMHMLIDKIYDNFEASNALLIRASKYNSEIHAYEIERLKKKHKVEIKKAYFEGSNSTNGLIQSLYKQIEQPKDNK